MANTVLQIFFLKYKNGSLVEFIEFKIINMSEPCGENFESITRLIARPYIDSKCQFPSTSDPMEALKKRSQALLYDVKLHNNSEVF